MAAINYGTVAVVPKGVWDATTQYNVANLVTYDGSSYLAHSKPPVGTLPTDAAYWQVSAQGTNKATANAAGVVKPDGETITVDTAGTISAKKAAENSFGIVSGGSKGVTVGSDGVMGVDTTFTQATELANIIAAEAFSTVLGKVSKAIAATMSLNENALLKNMLSSVDVNDTGKIPTSAYIHKLVERIGMGTDLDSGDSLTAAVNSLNSDLTATNSNFFEVGTLLENTLMQTIDFPQSLSRPPLLVAAQINLFEGVWVNLAEISGFTNFACNNYQLAINKDASDNCVGYRVRFLLKK